MWDEKKIRIIIKIKLVMGHGWILHWLHNYKRQNSNEMTVQIFKLTLNCSLCDVNDFDAHKTVDFPVFSFPKTNLANLINQMAISWTVFSIIITHHMNWVKIHSIAIVGF